MTVTESITKKAKSFPLLSHSATRLMEEVGNPEHTLNDIVKIVENDSVLTAQLLKRVNSVDMGLVETVTSVSRAVSYLGDRMVVSIAIDTCAPQIFRKELTGYVSKRGELWEHSLKTAIASREVAMFATTGDSPDIAFTAGILHDIGKAIISEYLSESLPDIVNKLDKRNTPDFLEEERQALGTDHCIIGGELSKHWKLSPILVAAIKHHHAPEEAEEEFRGIASIVHLGDMIAMMTGSGTGADSMQYSLHSSYTKYINMDKDKVGEIMINMLTEFETTRSFLFGEET